MLEYVAIFGIVFAMWFVGLFLLDTECMFTLMDKIRGRK